MFFTMTAKALRRAVADVRAAAAAAARRVEADAQQDAADTWRAYADLEAALLRGECAAGAAADAKLQALRAACDAAMAAATRARADLEQATCDADEAMEVHISRLMVRQSKARRLRCLETRCMS